MARNIAGEGLILAIDKLLSNPIVVLLILKLLV